MDKELKIIDLKDKVQQFCEDRDWDQFHNPKELAIGAVTEAAELLDIFRFKSEEDMEEIMNNIEKRKDVEDELADTFFFLLRFCQLYDIDLSTALINKIEKNSAKYPIDKFRGSNKKSSEV
ncbi:nucleotide pyrophosphohydrolase [Clostridium polyendosporum]|uniref:Nucleotide pyrophosphohydrolase n=1 Tax=Clostridium polyendosporum TaxID=69208 RepID=A0A919VDV5_9CLOT|nr:nucleotide pyrophosphohydrolase [Clostridium polyendosporum]GIM28439.1 nucleotide pyrophosphohydrolase [Clostridium polyendosporum]